MTDRTNSRSETGQPLPNDLCPEEVAAWVAQLAAGALDEEAQARRNVTSIWGNQIREVRSDRVAGATVGPDELSFDFEWRRDCDATDRILTSRVPDGWTPLAIWRTAAAQPVHWQPEEWTFDLPVALWPAGTPLPRALAAADRDAEEVVVKAAAHVGFVATPRLGPPRTLNVRLFGQPQLVRRYAAELRFEQKAAGATTVEQPLSIQVGEFKRTPLPMTKSVGRIAGQLGGDLVSDELTWEVPDKLPAGTRCRLLIRPLDEREQLRMAEDARIYRLTALSADSYQAVRQPEKFGLSGQVNDERTGFLMTPTQCAAQQLKMLNHVYGLAQMLAARVRELEGEDVAQHALERMEASIERGADTPFVNDEPDDRAKRYFTGTFKKSKQHLLRVRGRECSGGMIDECVLEQDTSPISGTGQWKGVSKLRALAEEFFRCNPCVPNNQAAFMLHWFSTEQHTWIEIARLVKGIDDPTPEDARELRKAANSLCQAVRRLTRNFIDWLDECGFRERSDG